MADISNLSSDLAKLSETISTQKQLQSQLDANIAILQSQIAILQGQISEAKHEREEAIKTITTCESSAVLKTRAYVERMTAASSAQLQAILSAPGPSTRPSHTTSIQSTSTVWRTVRILVGPLNVPSVSFLKQPAPIHREFTTVLFIANSWIELRCRMCGANAGVHSNSKFYTLAGFQRHFMTNHGTSTTVDKVLDLCEGRLVSDRDVKLMKHGAQPQDAAVMKKARQVKRAMPAKTRTARGPGRSSDGGRTSMTEVVDLGDGE